MNITYEKYPILYYKRGEKIIVEGYDIIVDDYCAPNYINAKRLNIEEESYKRFLQSCGAIQNSGFEWVFLTEEQVIAAIVALKLMKGDKNVRL